MNRLIAILILLCASCNPSQDGLNVEIFKFNAHKHLLTDELDNQWYPSNFDYEANLKIDSINGISKLDYLTASLGSMENLKKQYEQEDYSEIKTRVMSKRIDSIKNMIRSTQSNDSLYHCYISIQNILDQQNIHRSFISTREGIIIN